MAGGRGYDIFPRTGKARALLALAFLAGITMVPGTLLLMGLAHRGLDVTFENRTGVDVTVLVDRQEWGTVGAEESETFTDYDAFWDESRLIEVVDQSGRKLFSMMVTRGDLEVIDYRIVIEEPEPDQLAP